MQVGGHELLVIRVDHAPVEFPELTATENQVAQGVVDGKSNKEIAAERGVSAKTVANQLRAIYEKLGIASRFELAARARSGSQPPEEASTDS